MVFSPAKFVEWSSWLEDWLRQNSIKSQWSDQRQGNWSFNVGSSPHMKTALKKKMERAVFVDGVYPRQQVLLAHFTSYQYVCNGLHCFINHIESYYGDMFIKTRSSASSRQRFASNRKSHHHLSLSAKRSRNASGWWCDDQRGNPAGFWRCLKLVSCKNRLMYAYLWWTKIMYVYIHT